MSNQHPSPSDRARELVAGGYDTHVHVAPDVMQRRITDIELAPRFAAVGMAGFVLKSHYASTAERAQVVRAVVPETDVLGAITLNGAVGGLNPLAVEIAGQQGARVVWMPTVDSLNQRRSRASAPAGATPPMWAAVQDDLAEQGIMAEPVAVVDEAGRAVQAVRQVCMVIAKHGMVLATGHLSSQEIPAVVDAALEVGVQQVVITHPEFTSQQMPVSTQRQLAARGVLLERCFTTPYTGKVSWQEWLSNIRDVGPEHSVISSDLGQPFNPPVEDGLALAADRLLEAGFTEDEVRVMAVTNSRRIAHG